MAAYIVGQLDVKNTNWQQDYGPQARALLEKHGGKVIVGPGGAIERLEGRQTLPTAMSILEFPSVEQAKAWYNDPEYAPLIKLRQTGADLDFILVEGM
jgi:uncharacterized protein (DUF1330 family)